MEMPPSDFEQEVHRNAIGGIWGSTIPFGFTPSPVILGTEESLMISSGSPNLLYLVAGVVFPSTLVVNFLFVCFPKGLTVIYKLRQTDFGYLKELAQIRLSPSAAREDLNKIKRRD